MAKAKTRKKRPTPSLYDEVERIIWRWRWNRPGHRTARRALVAYQANLKEIEKTRKWLHRQRWFDPDSSAVDSTLQTLEEQTRSEVVQLEKASRAPAEKPAKLTPLLVRLAKHLYPKGMKKGERSQGAKEIARLLKQHGVTTKTKAEIDAATIRSLLEQYHQRHRNTSPFK